MPSARQLIRAFPARTSVPEPHALVFACLIAALGIAPQAGFGQAAPGQTSQGALQGQPPQEQDSKPASVERQDWDAKFQTTYIWQNKPSFHSPYAGPNSLSPNRETSYTWTVTAYLGWRPWEGGELYFNPEGIQGRALSNVTGLGGPSNAELQKAVATSMRFYRARLYYRHTWDLGGTPVAVESDQNQLAGMVQSRRFALTVGNLSLTDVMGTSEISGDGRTQFMNWATLDHGHYDYAADARGFSWGFLAELYWDQWAIRGGRFLQPKVSNGLPLDWRIFKRYGDQIELERNFEIGGQPGVVKVFGFRNVAYMANFRDALAAAAPGQAPTLDGVRKPQSKIGGGVSWEQSITSELRAEVRFGAHDGKTESYAFTEIDRSFLAAAQLKGKSWGRSNDNIGLAYARNGLSSAHRDYLAAGGTGFFLGDGQLNYGNEQIIEAYYSYVPLKGLSLSLDWQHIRNPGYNRDRGPVNIGSVRLHYEF
jgi:hypothetical protein